MWPLNYIILYNNILNIARTIRVTKNYCTTVMPGSVLLLLFLYCMYSEEKSNV